MDLGTKVPASIVLTTMAAMKWWRRGSRSGSYIERSRADAEARWGARRADRFWSCGDSRMLRGLEIKAVLCELEKAHRDSAFWEPRIELSLDCFVCERVGRTTVVALGSERAVCMSRRDEQHFSPARISGFDVTSHDDRLMLRSIVEFWWAPFVDAKNGEQAHALSRWVRLHFGLYCPHQEASSKGSVQTNVRRPHQLVCGECRTEVGVDVEVPSIRLVN